jgi:hypothetical protein
MLSGLLLTLLAVTPSQAEPPKQLPPAAPQEGMRAPQDLPKLAEVMLPAAGGGCTSCGVNVAQYPSGCSSGTCVGTTCIDAKGPPNVAWNDQVFGLFVLKDAPLPNLLVNAAGSRLIATDTRFGRTVGGGNSGGSWFNDEHTLGYGFSILLLEQRSTSQLIRSDASGNPALVRPFTDALTGDSANFFAANPGILQGRVAVETGARYSSGEYYGLKNILYDQCHSLNVHAGLRYMDLDEYLQIFQNTSAANGTTQTFPINGTQTSNGPINIVDRFRTRNQFYGLQLGIRGDYTHGVFSVGLSQKIAVGNNHQTLDIAGQTSAAGLAPVRGGFLALAPNIGYTRANRFAVLSESSIEGGLQVTQGSKLFAAFDFIYINEVIRPGVMVDSVVNTRFVPSSANFGTLSGPSAPLRTQNRTDFFTYGVRFGYQVQF